jgi:tetratricopeptide (TPR) repeat protein
MGIIRLAASWLLVAFGVVILTIGVARANTNQTDKPIVLTLAEIPWALEIRESGFSIKSKIINLNKEEAKLLAENPWTQSTITAFIEDARKKGGAKACRDYHWWQIRKSPFDLKDARLYESGPWAIVEYSITKIGTTVIHQKFINAYQAIDRYWIGIEIARTFHDPAQDSILHSILDHITINPAYVPTAQEQFGYASYYFLKKDYLKAVQYFQAVLQRKEPGSSLNRDSWRVLVDQLGMSYGLSGELDKAKDLFEWAIPIDPEYPMFYYNLACTFSEKGDLDRALENLRLALRYKENMIKGETFPDPRTDASFKKHRRAKSFWAELLKLK